jgi:hypothetical protein
MQAAPTKHSTCGSPAAVAVLITIKTVHILLNPANLQVPFMLLTCGSDVLADSPQQFSVMMIVPMVVQQTPE